MPDCFLAERMVPDPVAELIVGVHRGPQFGAALTGGASGILVELLRDTATLLLPTVRREIRAVLASQDAEEGPCAFAERRRPVWSGR
ncbi:acetate--CoA ligase family protein [Streptomyces sp. NPDC050523]|uniref:acetate--CoA ligase family protein n=1 Tax=Streptomyces sp. NPDC050523 TaxID=3365622 RepID=UPI0037AD63C5